MSRATERASSSTTVAKGRWKNNGPLVNEIGALIMEDTEKVQLLNAFFSSLFTKGQLSRIQNLADKRVWRKEDFPLVKEDWVQDNLHKLDGNLSMDADGIHPQVLRKIANVIAKPHSIIFERSWSAEDLSENWREANVTLVFKKGV